MSHTATDLEDLAAQRADHAELGRSYRESAARLDEAFARAAATWSYREIARVVGCSPSEVERRVHAFRARQQS